jgi:hypothetical protein
MLIDGLREDFVLFNTGNRVTKGDQRRAHSQLKSDRTDAYSGR